MNRHRGKQQTQRRPDDPRHGPQEPRVLRDAHQAQEEGHHADQLERQVHRRSRVPQHGVGQTFHLAAVRGEEDRDQDDDDEDAVEHAPSRAGILVGAGLVGEGRRVS